EGAVHAAQQGGLAAAVGADDADRLAGADDQVGGAQPLCVAEGFQAEFGHGAAPSGRRRISQRKKGPPMRAVRTPTGMSWGAATVRAARSARTRASAPPSAATGSIRRCGAPTAIRAACGAIRPMKPTAPLAATRTAVTREARTKTA